MALNISIEEARVKAASMFIYISEILKKKIIDLDGNVVGNVWDIAAKLGDVYPKSEELIVSRGVFQKKYASIPWSKVKSIDDDIILNVQTREVQFGPTPKEYEFLLKRDILDQQVVDTFNHKVRRVNDIHLLKVDHDLVAAHVDIGLRGLARRLDWEKAVDLIIRSFAKNAPYLKKEDLVSWKFVQPVSINPASMTVKLSFSQNQLSNIPAADLGEMIFDLNPTQRMAIFRMLDVKVKAKLFENLEFEEQNALLKELDKKELAQIVGFMSADEATDLLEKLPNTTVKNLLTLIESGRSKKLSTLLGYSSDSAGGLMTTEFIAMPETMTTEEAIEYIKTKTREDDVIPYVYLVDDKNRLKGITTIRKILVAEAKDPVGKTSYPKTVCVHLHDGMKEVAYVMDKYKISAIPVVDENKVLSGIIAMDDVLSQVISIAWRKRPSKTKGI